MRLTELVHLELKQTIQPGDTVIDATAGNGHDTLLMAELVGPSGKVIAIDLQEAAIEATKSRLEEAGKLAQVELIQGDHAKVLSELITQNISAAAVTFNLGYLPGGAKEVTTSPETTLRALDAAKSLIKQGGILLVTTYRGHDGGMEEANQVEAWMQALSPAIWQATAIEPPTRSPDRVPPVLWIAQRKVHHKEANPGP